MNRADGAVLRRAVGEVSGTPRCWRCPAPGPAIRCTGDDQVFSAGNRDATGNAFTSLVPHLQGPRRPPKNALERALSLFADVRAGRRGGTILLTVNVFLLLAGYSVMKPARDGLILTEGGAEIASYSAAAQGVLLMGLVPFYGWLGTKVVRIRLLDAGHNVLCCDTGAVLCGWRRGSS